MKRILVCVALIAMLGCDGDRQQTAPVVEQAKQPAATPARDLPTEVEMVASMEAHYSAVILAHDALLQGDLEKFRSQLVQIPEQSLPPSSPRGWLPLHDRLKSAAADAAGVADLDAAAQAFASVVLACGTCHTAVGMGPTYPAPAPDEGADALAEAMLEHQWATERMWEGVTGPWDNAWERGAEALAEIQVFGDTGVERVLTPALKRREQELRDLGHEAMNTTALEERAALYGRLLSTCGACHQAIGVTFDESD